MSREISINKWIEKFDSGEFDRYNLDTQIDAGWFDWFCRDESLTNKTKSLGKKVKRIASLLSDDFKKKHYVWFKNNCPLEGKLYDDFRFSNKKTGDVIFTIVPRSGFDKDHNAAFLWGKVNGFNGPIVSGSWSDIVDYFKENKW